MINMRMRKEYASYANLWVRLLKEKLKGNMVSVVLFGSVARREAGEGSDIDLLVVVKGFKTFRSRFDVFDEIEKELKDSKECHELKERRFGALVSPIPLTTEEINKSPSILLDVVTDGIILHDTDNFMGNYLNKLRKKLEKIGAGKIFLGDGKWYWDLKPDYKLGGVVEI
jgi:hypothetical protein